MASSKHFWSRPMGPWTSVAAYECAAAQPMDPWAAIKKASKECGGDASFCPGPHPMAACPEFHIGCRLGRELFPLPYAVPDAHGVMGLRPKCFNILLFVAAIPTPVRFPIQRPLVPSFT